jgi:hypothetical protein
MAVPRDTLNDLVDRLPDADLSVAQRFLESLSQDRVDAAFAASIRRGIAEVDAGQTIDCHSYDDMVEKLLGKE